MNTERFAALMADDGLSLTEAEIAAQWHFCPSWDGLLISPECGEWRHCECEFEGKRPCTAPPEPECTEAF